MSNYDFSLDMKTDNSNSLILKTISKGSKVLEVGCAHGRMTKYLKENLDCDITIVEVDKEAGKVASQYSNNAILGGAGNIEDTYWFYETDGKKFDHIIFADVLEHLSNPEAVLLKAMERLSDNGSILISIPNISHNAVLIDLLQDKFEYRETGILDKTHVKFFTHNSLRQMIEKIGLSISKEFNAVNVVSNTEFNNSYSQLPEEVSLFLKSREYGEVYQFVWELKKKNINVSVITPIFNKWLFTKSYLDDMIKLPSDVEIIIVDNASSDETQDSIKSYLDKYPHKIKYIRNSENTGFSKACNSGLKSAIGNKILFLNNDIKVRNNFSSWIYNLSERCTDNNLVGPTGGAIDMTNGFNFLYETNSPTKPINYMSGWCLMMSREVCNKIATDGKIFDEDFFAYYEDTSLGMKSHQLGIKFCLVDIPVVHFGKISSKQLNTYALYKQSKEIFMEKWKHLLQKKE